MSSGDDILHAMKKEPLDTLQTECIDICSDATDHIKLLRDYATTPGNAWLAKGELSKLNGLMSDLDSLLDQIKRSN